MAIFLTHLHQLLDAFMAWDVKKNNRLLLLEIGTKALPLLFLLEVRKKKW
jgi:hypothetical protein